MNEHEEPKLCVHYSDDCPLCEDDREIAAESAKAEPKRGHPSKRIYYADADGNERFIPAFNEADCGGVFDGFGVISDADPGL